MGFAAWRLKKRKSSSPPQANSLDEKGFEESDEELYNESDEPLRPVEAEEEDTLD
jgi:hypothetical protein